MNSKPELEESYSIEEMEKIRQTQKIEFKYTLPEVILFLLYADKEEPIKGKIRQMKEVFLTLNQIFLNQGVQPVYFKKHRFGPYSQEVEHTIDQLLFTNFISISGRKNTKDFAIGLTEKAGEKIKLKYDKLPENIQKLLKQKRIEWDTHIPQGILKLVYRDYEEFLENSVFKKRYQKLDWDDIEQRPSEE